MSNIVIKNLTFEIASKYILKDINLKFEKNKFIGLIGENGSGKSTILKHIYKECRVSKNSIFIENKDIVEFNRKDFAKKIAVLGQENSDNIEFTVEEVIRMGRYAQKKFLGAYNLNDTSIVNKIIREMELDEYKNKLFNELSGGEKQRVLIARAIVQKTDVIILDEPLNHLDVKYQLQIMRYLKNLNKTIIMTIHDINVASRYCDYLIGIKKGSIIDQGETQEVLTKKFIREVYGLDSLIQKNPITEKKHIYFIESI